MPRCLRADEEAARQTIIRELGIAVEPHDDGTQDAMYDLQALMDEDQLLVIEVTAARDPISSQIENTVDAYVPLPPGSGSWLVELLHAPASRDVASAVVDVIEMARSAGVTDWELGMSSHLRVVPPDVHAARALDARMGTAGFSRIHDITTWVQRMVTDGVTGIEVAAEDQARVVEALPPDDPRIMSPTEFVEWIGEYIEGHPDLRAKTGGDHAHEHHLYLYVHPHVESVRAATLLATGLVHRLTDAVPATVTPDAARISPYTHIWLALTGGGIGIRWDGQSWRLFAPLPERD